MNTSSMLRLGGTVLAALALAASASAGSKYGSYYKNFGNSKGGGWVSAYGLAYTSSSSAGAEACLWGGFDLLGKHAKVGGVCLEGYASPGSASGKAYIDLAGVTVWKKSLSSTAWLSKSIQLNAFTPGPSMTVWVGPVPVTASGNVGAGGRVSSGFYIYPYSSKVRLSGSSSGWGNGWVSAGLGVSGYSLGVTSELKFGTQALTFNYEARCGYSPSGTMKYSMTALKLALKFVVKAWPFSWSKTLASYSAGSYSKNLF